MFAPRFVIIVYLLRDVLVRNIRRVYFLKLVEGFFGLAHFFIRRGKLVYDFLFSVINAGRLYHINPDNALERTNRKFIRRFNYVEQAVVNGGRELKDLTLSEMDALWDEAKRQEKP